MNNLTWQALSTIPRALFGGGERKKKEQTAMDVPGLAKGKERFCECLGSCSFPCECLAFSPCQLLSLHRSHHRKTLAARHVTPRTPQAQLGGFSGCGPGETYSTRGGLYPALLPPSPHPPWVSFVFLNQRCSAERSSHFLWFVSKALQ